MKLLRFLILLSLASPALAADPTSGGTPSAGSPTTAQSATSSQPQPAGAGRAAPSPAAALAANIHALRIAVEQQDASELAAQRLQTPVSTVAASDPTSTDALRSQLATSMASLDNRCLGVNARATNGSVILICGDNSGEVTNTQTRSVALIPGLTSASAPGQTLSAQGAP
jgi:hypothetical protein